MIYNQSLRNECTTNAAAVALVTLVFSLIIFLIRLLNEMSAGLLDADALGPLLTFAVIKFLPILLPLSCFLGVLLTLSRWYRDSEMAVWLSSGVSLAACFRPVLIFSIPIMIITGLITQSILPWAYVASNKIRENINAQNEVAFSRAGSFREIGGGSRVLYVEESNQDTGKARNVFISDSSKGSLGIVVAKAAHEVSFDNGDRFIFLDNGHRYELNGKTNELKQMAFREYGFRVGVKSKEIKPNIYDGLTTYQLIELATPQSLGDVVTRVGLMLMALILSLLAIPLSYVNPRGGRSPNLIIALLVYFIYYNLLTLLRSWVMHEKIPFIVGLLFPHIVMIIVFATLFSRRIRR